MVKETKITAYVCEICDREFLDKTEAQECEDSHSGGKPLTIMKSEDDE